MLMADTMAVFFVILGLLLAFPGLWLLCRGLWPRTVELATVRCHRGLRSSFLVGVVTTFLMVLLTIILANRLGSVGKIAGIVLVCLYLLHAHTGVAGLATAIGQRLASPQDESRPWRATLRGGLVLELTYLLPILGWFGILPLSIIIGSGAVTLALPKQLQHAFKRSKVIPETADAAATEVTGEITSPAGVL